MGEMADDFLDEVLDMEDLRFDFHHGILTFYEAFEKGIIDELGFEETK